MLNEIRRHSWCLLGLFILALLGGLVLDTRLRLSRGGHVAFEAVTVLAAYIVIWLWVSLHQRS